MLLLITAAGKGSRFRREGIEMPKPLIRVHGRTLLEHTLESFELKSGDQLIIAVQRSQEICQQLDQTLRQTFAEADLQWIELDAVLPGQLATAVHALKKSNLEPGKFEEPLLIHNCDTGFLWNSELLPTSNTYGSMAVFPAEGEHWSFGKPDPNNPKLAIAIAEKERISNLASIGLYGFASIERFLEDANLQIQSTKTLKGEYYVAPLLNSALKRGEIVEIPRVNGVRLYGTPAELCKSFGIEKEELLNENNRTDLKEYPQTN